jgi:hypothetical protein
MDAGNARLRAEGKRNKWIAAPAHFYLALLDRGFCAARVKARR